MESAVIVASQDSNAANETSQKKTRQRLRRRQRALLKAFRAAAPVLDTNNWASFANEFQEALREDELLEYCSVDTRRYAFGIANLLLSLGFKIHTGDIPRASGTRSDWDTAIYAYDDHRLVVVDSFPENTFTTIADIQPVCPLPVLGLLYNSSVEVEHPKYNWPYTAEAGLKARRLAGALALGYFSISIHDLRAAVSLSPFGDRERLQQLAASLGLVSFFGPPVDSLPVFGHFASSNHHLQYSAEQFVKDAAKTEGAGAGIAAGDVTKASREEALADPDYFFKQLERSKLLRIGKGGVPKQTGEAWRYLRTSVLPFPLGQLLNYTCLAAREEMRKVVRDGFVKALANPTALEQVEALPPFIALEECDSFAKIAMVSPHTVSGHVPVQASEKEVKGVIHRILADPFQRKDWGGEQDDLFTTRLIYKGRRLPAAFLLKGPAVKGRLTIARCGKNGDQIQRLFKTAAEVFVIQFNGEIDEAVVEEARQKTVQLRQSGRKATYCIVDGLDTARLLRAYGPGAV